MKTIQYVHNLRCDLWLQFQPLSMHGLLNDFNWSYPDIGPAHITIVASLHLTAQNGVSDWKVALLVSRLGVYLLWKSVVDVESSSLAEAYVTNSTIFVRKINYYIFFDKNKDGFNVICLSGIFT